MRLTLPQKQIYYTEMFNKDAINVNCGSVLLDKLYDVKTIEKAVNDIFRINEALRTRVYVENGEPYQCIFEYTEKAVEVLSFKSREEVHEYGEKQAQIPMNLSEELCEIKVISSEEFCGVFYKIHHIISDAFTFSLISSQMHKLLEGIPVEAFPYSDYIVEEESYVFSKRAQKDKAFFLEQYNNMNELVHFSDSLPVRGESERFVCSIDKDITFRIKAFAESKGVSEYIVFLTLISIYIAKYKNYSGNFYIGTPVLNRSSVNQLNTVGMFVNNVPFPVRVEENKTFEYNLDKTKNMFFNVLKHQKFNYICALNELNIDQSYDVSFSFQNSTIYGDSFKSTWYHNKVQSESLQIHIDDRDNEGVFNISYDYQIDKFTEKDIKNIHAHLCCLLIDAIENPSKETYALNLISAKEKQKILYEFNDTSVEFSQDKCVHQLFEEQAKKSPDKTAVVATNKTLTYKELNEEANRIAHSLIEKGVGKGDIVAFKLPRRSYLIATMFGILKAGAAYMPLDPDYPQARIDYMLSDSGAKFCITEENISALLDNSIISNPNVLVDSSDNCYCIYTSGSTGKPKGVLVCHKNVVNFCTETPVNNLQSCIANKCTFVLACGSITFDISNFEIVLSLSLNKSVVLANEQEVSNADLLAELIEKNSIDCVHCTPTKLWTYFYSEKFSAAFRHIKCVMVGGEQFAKDLYFTIRSYSNATVFNGYGPTETTMGATFGEINGGDITIGKPIANTQIYIVDKYLNTVPIGVTGEICIAGDGVGAGYLNRPELTAEKFIDNPFGEGKLYKTGDLAYWRDDGNIIFVGRNDFQVKIRGLRIELGEIENAITSIDGINMSVVVVRKDSQDRQLICAFYTGEEKSAQEIRSIIGENLPKYMIPHTFMHLEEMPLTSSGKINKNSLPEVNFNSDSTEAEYVAPVTEEETVLSKVVATNLNIERVSMLDNFFNIGGDSIKAIYIVSELAEKGYELSVSDIMQKDTLSDIAEVMKPVSEKAIYDQEEVNGFIPFSPIMRAFVNGNNPITKDFVHTCIVSADCDEDTARKALDALISHHDILRGVLCDNGIEVYPSSERNVYSFKAVTISDEEKAKEYLSNTDIEEDKLVNVVFCNTESNNLISITIHHFLIDLVSWEVLIKDFQAVVRQLNNNDEISLPNKTASFMNWSSELQKYSETISEETKEYWKNINSKLNNTKTLCLQEDNEQDAENYSFSLDENTSYKLINEANKAYGTRTNEILLTALGLAAGKIADGSVGIMVESHGRTQLQKPIAIQRTVGWFTSCYPVVVDNNNNLADELINVKETLRRIPNNGIDYLLLSQSFHKNADIIFNFYKSGTEDGETENKLIEFNAGNSVFQGKINVNCIIADNILTVDVSLSKCKHKKKICEELGFEFVKQIENIVYMCTTTDAVIKTCSDFSDQELSGIELSELRELFAGSNIEDIYGLTPSQEGMYAQYFQSADSKAYRLQSLCKINKESDFDILAESVELLSLRHRIFRTAFTVLKSSGAIKQVILENRKPIFNIFTKAEPFSQKVLENIIDKEIPQTFDLQRDSLFRVVIIDFYDERFMFICTHHIILDGWCLPVIFNDLQRYYSELSGGRRVEDLSEEIQKEVLTETSFAQYANWIKNQDDINAVGYWQNLLKDCSVAHIFGKEKKDNLKPKDIITFKTPLSYESSQSIEQFARKAKVSPNTVFECAFGIVLQKFSGSDEIIFDKIISGRSISLKNIDNTVGPFINTVPVRVNSDEINTLTDLLKETQKQTVNANKYGILPLSEVYKACDVDSKSIDALFVFENYYTGDTSDIENGALSPKLVYFDEQTEFNLTVTILKENDRYVIRTSYAKEVFTESDISNFIKGYISVIDSSLVENKQTKDISVADMSLINSFNDTAHTYDIPENSTLYSLFEKIAKENKEKICIKTAEKELLFGELLDISERLDAQIRKITKGDKSVVAVIAERSAEMYAAVYGIIRGGNAYLPIDPSYPQERIEYILENSGAVAVVAQGKFTEKSGKLPCIDMTILIKNTQANQIEVSECAATPDDTAYVIYTSGSTGAPKGARVSHKSAVNRIMWMHDKYPLGTEDVILQKTPYTFDVSVWELFWWGMCGGSLAVSKPGEHFLPVKILDEVYKNKVTHLHFVPSVFELFLNYLETHTEEIGKFNSVRYVFLSGEALSASLVKRFYELYDYNKVTLHNLYGPTECAVDVTYYDCGPADIDPVPIGKPIYNTQMYVVDKYNNILPIGVTGELCIAGMNVGQGYINNTALTAEKFIDNPFGKGKLYKTGDLAYWREDGNIIFAGRKDNQVKLNGQRIEIGEIESVIGDFQDVDSVSVVMKKVASADMLVAFYTGKKDCEKEIKRYCLSKLPKYMVPAAFVHLDTLPLNQSGKLDRKALADKKVEIVQLDERETPVNDTEIFVCKAFESVLGVGDIGRNSNFFDLGGTSLSMISLLSKDGFGTITAAEFMRNPTPVEIAKLMNNKNVVDAEYLEPLYVSDVAEQAIVLLPFAGGGAEMYSNFVNSLKRKNDRTSVYFIRYLHSADECKKAADEIIKLLADTEIIMYSHCVGAAVALQILNHLEKSDLSVKHYFAAAIVPPLRPNGKNIWNKVPDRVIKAVLSKAGADFGRFSDDKVSAMLKDFRKDTDFANLSFAGLTQKIKTPMSVIVSKKDIFTKNYRQAEKSWNRYAENVTEISFVDSESHYFQSEKSDETIEIMLGSID